MHITIDTILFVAILSLLFLVGVISGIKLAYAKMMIKILKRISPKEFERLMEEEDESGKHSTISSGCLHKHTKREAPQHKISSK